MDTRSLQMYKEALNEGKEKVYNIRVMVVGQYGVGKTTLTQRLLGKNVNISERHSTDGIDVHVECSKVSLPAGEWTTEEKNAEQYTRLQRLVKFLNEHAQKQESKSEQVRQSELDGLVTSEEHDNGHPQHDQVFSKEYDNEHPQHEPVSVEPDTNQEVELPTSQPVDSPIAKVVPEASSEKEAKENKKDTVMEILQLVNENSGNLEKSMGEYAALALWDFAGQYVFYTTHQTFLTSRAIYLLVIDLSQQVTDLIKDDECFLDMEGIKLCKVHDLIEIWMNSIHSCTPSSQPGIPYVILVGTHVDKIPENCRQRVIDEYFIHICEILSNKPASLHLIDSIAIDNTQGDPRLEELKKIIFELAKQQPHWGEEKPARWLPLEHKIMTLKASGVKVAPLSLIEEINRSESVRIENRDELDLFLRFQHDMGTILYFGIEGLREKILLDPQWLIDAQKSLITAGTFINKNPAIVSKWSEFKRSGKLTHELIDAVWSKEKNPEFYDNKDYILLLMEKLNIIARPRAYDHEGKEIKVENYFLAPCMLRETTPEEVISPKPLSEMDSSSVLCYVFVEKFLPSPIFHRLLAACVAHWPVAKKNSEILIYCGCCVFHLNLHHRLTVFFRGHVIFVRVTRMATTGKTPSSQLCTQVKEFITMTLSNIIGNLEQSLRFELHIQCPRSDGYSVNSLIPVADLQDNVDVPCHSHTESHVIMSSDLLKFWFQEEAGVEGKRAGKESKVFAKDVASTENAPSSSSKKEKLHRTVLNRCLPELMNDLDIRTVMMYIQQKELFGDVTIRDILEQKTTSDSISMLIRLVQKRSQRTYKRFKECLVMAKQADLKEMLEEEEAKRAEEIKGKRHDTASSTFELKTQTPVAPTSMAQTTHLPNVQISATKGSTTASTTKAVATAAPTTIEETSQSPKMQTSTAKALVTIPPVTKRLETAAPTTVNQTSQSLKVQASTPESSATAAPTTIEHITQSPNVQTSAAKFSTSTAPVTKAVETASQTTIKQATLSPKVQTSAAKFSTPTAPVTKALATAAHTTIEQTTHSPKVQTSTAKVSTTAAPVTKALVTAAPTTTAQTTKSPKPQASATKASTAVASRTKSKAVASPSTEESAIVAKQSKACYLM